MKRIFTLSFPIKKGLLLLFVLFTCKLYAADYYWVGGGGNWSDLSHWRLGSSSGSIPSIVPAAGDNIFFDANSGFGTTVTTRTVNLDANAFCNNMTWVNVPNNPRFIAADVNFKIEIWGSLNLSASTFYQAIFVFRGATAATLKTNGQVQGNFGIDINKPGSSLTVVDSLIIPSNSEYATNIISLTEGIFDISGKKLTCRQFYSNNSNTRTLNMTNAGLSLHWAFTYMGANKTLNAAGSEIYQTGYLQVDNGNYNKVSSYGIYSENFSVFNCTFSTLTFTTPNPLSEARIHDGNTVDSMRFMGAGLIRNNNNVNVIIAATALSINNDNTVDRITSGGGVMGTGNTVGYWKSDGNFTVTGTGTNTTDSLLLAAKSINTFRGTFNVNKYLYLEGEPCEAFTAVSGDSTAGSVNFASGAVVDMNNVILTGIKAYGPVTPIAMTGIDNGGNAGFAITAPSASSTTLYWVGGPGDWNDRNHWSTSSGGGGGACIPYIGDDVIFDINSGLGSGTVTTSGTSFCRNMTWTDIGTVTFAESASYAFNIHGSLVMDPSVTMNAFLEFEGSDAASITTNGNTLGTLQFIIQKTGGAVITLTDNWSNPAGGSFAHRSGGLSLNGRTVNLALYTSTINAPRSLNITNATLNFTSGYDYRGTGKAIASTGSHITSVGFGVDGLTYPLVDVSGVGAQLAFYNTTLGQLTFHSTSATSQAAINSGNTIRRLEFKGRGAIGGTNTIDTLILAGSRNYLFSGTNTINKYMQAQSVPCTGLSEVRGNPTGTLAFTSGAVASISNIYMQNMTATGPVTPIAFNGADAGGNTGWTITSASGGSRYWVGGAGDWNDASHWSTTSGGTSGACIPTVFDDVYFDANSGFTSASKTITINNGNAYCRNVNWTGALNNPTWSKSVSWNLEVWGDSLIMTSPATFNLSLTLKGPNAAFMKGGSPLGSLDIYIDKPGSGLTLLNDYSNTQGRFFLTNGAFNATGRTLAFSTFTNQGLPNTSSVDISNSTLTLGGGWVYTGSTANHTLNAANSTITSQYINATGLTYNKVNVNGSSSNTALLDGTTIDSLVFTLAGNSSQAGINGAGNQLNYVEYKGSGGIYGTNNTIDTLVFFPGSRYVLNSGTNTTITGEWYGSGTPCRLTEIVSSSTTNATITKTSGDVTFDYIRLQRITGTGGATYNTQQHSINLGGNTGWTMAPYDGAAPIYGLGPDMSVATSSFPVVLRTDGFFGNPSSQYTWNDNSTADTLLVSGPGTYSVTTSFVDGCSISDAITITEASTLPVTLISFTASLQNCESYLNWKTADAINFSHYVVEKSKDGSHFSTIGEIMNVESVYRYSYTDKNTGSGNSFYRLRLVDQDGTHKYSPVVSVRSDCEETIKVYPTFTSNEVRIVLPQQGYEKAQLYILNVAGQRMAPAVHGSGSFKTVNLQGLPASTYILQVVNGKETRSFKIIKQ